MDLITQTYTFFNAYFTNEQLIYFSSLLAFLTAFSIFYRKNIQIYVIKTVKWFKYIFNSFEHIEKIDLKLQTVINEVKNNKEIYEPSIKKLNDKLEFIEKELSPNSGKSIKDLIDKIITSTVKMENVTSSLDYQLKKIESRQWTVMVNNNDYPMFETDDKGYCIRANKAYLDLVGLHLDDVLSLGWINIIFIDDRKLVQNEWESAVADKRAFDIKYRIHNVNTNKVFLARCIAQPFFVDKEVIGYIGRFLNIVELIQDSSGIWVKKPT